MTARPEHWEGMIVGDPTRHAAIEVARGNLAVIESSTAEPKLLTRSVDFYYGSFQALKNVSIEMRPQEVTAFIGPSGCGKSTFLRVLNRMNDTIPGTRLTGEVFLDGENIYRPGLDVVELRKR